MKLYSYVVARDYGFAPNPFYGFCTLATCKPKIRSAAVAGDWIVGTGASSYGVSGSLVYAMQVSEVLSFDAYWNDPRFNSKKPNLHGSLKQAFGDNIYHRCKGGRNWCQVDSHHSHADGTVNRYNVEHDTQTDRVLIGEVFVYFGARARRIPARYRNYKDFDICAHRGHKCNFPSSLVDEFTRWILSLGTLGVVGDPAEFGSVQH